MNKGYRIQQHKHIPPIAKAHDVPTPSLITVKNGKVVEIGVPFWFYEIHDPERAFIHNRTLKDHLGYAGNISQERDLARHPEPCHRPPEGLSPIPHYQHGYHPSSNLHLHGRPDVCGPLCDQIDQRRLIPIHLPEYGYEWDITWEPQEGLSMSCWIDEDEDWVVRLKIDTNCPDAVDKPLRSRFAMAGTADDGRRTIISGLLQIVPGLVVPERN